MAIRPVVTLVEQAWCAGLVPPRRGLSHRHARQQSRPAAADSLLTANADALRESTQTIRTQAERGVVDIDAVKRANDSLIATIDHALRIADDGRRQRAEAEKQLVACETELKQALVAARNRVQRSATHPGTGPAS